MFERNKIDNVEHSAVPVEITLADGEVMKGRLLIAMGRNVFEVLNGAGTFVEFEPYGGERTYLAKAALHGVKMTNVPRSSQLSTRLRDMDEFDPHGVLGVANGSSLDEIKAAWHRKVKTYHPDRYTNADLPGEVREYLAAMARRVNAAYAALESPVLKAKQLDAQRARPVYSRA